MIKFICTILGFLLLTDLYGQFKPSGTFIGVIPIKDYKDPVSPNYKWYHLSELTFIGDSVFLEQSPIAIYKNDTAFSASDGGFYAYKGILKYVNNKPIALLTLVNCDYCPMQMIAFDPPKIMNDFDTIIVNEPGNKTKPYKDSRLKRKTFSISKTSTEDEILIEKYLFKRRKE